MNRAALLVILEEHSRLKLFSDTHALVAQRIIEGKSLREIARELKCGQGVLRDKMSTIEYAYRRRVIDRNYQSKSVHVDNPNWKSDRRVRQLEARIQKAEASIAKWREELGKLRASRA